MHYLTTKTNDILSYLIRWGNVDFILLYAHTLAQRADIVGINSTLHLIFCDTCWIIITLRKISHSGWFITNIYHSVHQGLIGEKLTATCHYSGTTDLINIFQDLTKPVGDGCRMLSRRCSPYKRTWLRTIFMSGVCVILFLFFFRFVQTR